MKPKEVRRREMLKALALAPPTLAQAATLESLGTIAHALETPATSAQDWKPRFLTSTQNHFVEILADLIIPETETPGASAALVNQHIDLILSEETKEQQRTFLEGLDAIDRISRSRHGEPFSKLSQDQQVALLTRLADDSSKSSEEEPLESKTAGRRFFLDIRRRTVFAYYTSRVGIHEELEYKGKQVLTEWKGCPHPEKHGDTD